MERDFEDAIALIIKGEYDSLVHGFNSHHEGRHTAAAHDIMRLLEERGLYKVMEAKAD